MQPFDYTIKQADPNQMIMGGLQNASAIMQVQNAQRESEAKVQLAQQQANDLQRKQEEAAMKQRRFSEVAQNPTSSAVRRLMVEFPELSEQFNRAVTSLSTAEKESLISTGSGVLFALEKGKNDIALNLIDRDLDAARNSGDESRVWNLENIKDSIQASPEGARFALKGVLMSAMGGKEYADSMKSLGEEERAQAEAPAKLSRMQAEAEKAAVDARFAESGAVIDLERKGWDIKKIQSDMQIAKMNSQIAAMNAQTSRMSAGAASQSNQIKLQELIDKRDSTVREKAAELESTRANIDNFLDTADRILQTPMGVVGSAAGPISSKMPTLTQSTADFEALVETLGNQVTMSRIGEMKGVLSDSDMKILRGSIQSLSLTQSPERLMKNVQESQRLMLKARKTAADKFGLPDSVPDTPSAAPSGNDIEALLRKYGQ